MFVICLSVARSGESDTDFDTTIGHIEDIIMGTSVWMFLTTVLHLATYYYAIWDTFTLLIAASLHTIFNHIHCLLGETVVSSKHCYFTMLDLSRVPLLAQ